jgi:hypothetical protein
MNQRMNNIAGLWPACIGLCLCAGAATGATPQSVELNSFETFAEQQMVHAANAAASITTAGATEGTRALPVDFQAGTWPFVRIAPNTPWDFRGFGDMAVDITNPTPEALQIYLLADDDPAADGWNPYRTGNPIIQRHLDGQNGNFGFVSIADTPYPEMVAAARAVHQDLYQRRYGN